EAADPDQDHSPESDPAGDHPGKPGRRTPDPLCGSDKGKGEADPYRDCHKTAGTAFPAGNAETAEPETATLRGAGERKKLSGLDPVSPGQTPVYEGTVSVCKSGSLSSEPSL